MDTAAAPPRGYLAALLDLLLPTDCGGCGRPGPPWCASCAAATGHPVPVALPGGPRGLAVGRYRGPLRSALLAYKERGRRDLGPALAALVAGVLPAGGPVVLVPVPSRRAAARARGGDHVLRWCRVLAASRPELAVAPVLRLAGRVRDSVGLDAGQRAANLHGRLEVVGRWQGTGPGHRLVLVDDVVTTGATLRACRAALAVAGVRVDTVGVLCDATGGRAGGQPPTQLLRIPPHGGRKTGSGRLRP
jgi:predicted amidophosphoribosyltransferase